MIQFRGSIPVTIHFAFWITAGIIGFINSASITGTLIWIGIILVSVLVHEFGHAITAKAFGQKPRIELVAFGGFTYPEGKQLKRWQEFIVVLNGPIFGFGLFVLAAALLQLPSLQEGITGGVLRILKMVNLFWTIFNLIPVFPLDGGQLLRITFEGIFGAKGFRYALIVGMIFGSAAAVIAFIVGYFIIGAFFFLFAFQSFEIYRRAKNMTEVDRDELVTKEVEEIDQLIEQKRYKEAIPHLEDLIARTKSGITFQRSSELLAHIYSQEQNWSKAYELLLPIKEELSPPARILLHKAAFEKQDFELVLALGGPCFQDLPEAEIALNNAIAAATLNQVEPAIGWLLSAQDRGLTNIKDVVRNPAFDTIRDNPSFKDLIC
ncbi:MAG: site-2 protease family protein [Chlamydiales bacterium]|nr:site-2 protease family protein [Chlamydiales bacterium]